MTLLVLWLLGHVVLIVGVVIFAVWFSEAFFNR